MKKYTHWFLIFSLFPLSLVAQEQPKVEQKTHKSTDGKLYWNRKLPAYLFISTSPDGSNPIRLESKTTPKWANPMYFDTEGINFIRHQWAVDQETLETIQPEIEVQFEVYNDGLAPITKIDINSAGKKFTKSGKTYYGGGSVSASLSSEDALSGVENIYQSVDGAAITTYKSSLSFSDDKDYTIAYYAADNVGNVEKVKTMAFTVDNTAPASSHTVEGTKVDNILAPSAKINISSNDAASGVKTTYYKFDDGTEKYYSRTISLASLSDGDHTLIYYAIDNVGNKEAVKTYQFYLDKTPPVVTPIVQGDRFNSRGRNYISGRTKIKLNATDNKAGVEKVYYNIDGKEFDVYSDPFPIKRSQGTTYLKFYAVDKVGNKGIAKTDNSLSGLFMDLTAPNVSYSIKGPQLFTRDTMFINSESTINITAYDQESGMQKITYSLDGGSEVDYKNPFSIPTEGVHKFTYAAIDQVFNRIKKDGMVIVDNQGPEVFFHPSMEKIAVQVSEEDKAELPVYAQNTQLYLAATDALVGTDKIYYKLDDGTTMLYGTPLKAKRTGRRKLEVWAIDELGNKSESTIIEFVIQ